MTTLKQSVINALEDTVWDHVVSLRRKHLIPFCDEHKVSFTNNVEEVWSFRGENGDVLFPVNSLQDNKCYLRNGDVSIEATELLDTLDMMVLDCRLGEMLDSYDPKEENKE